MRHGLDFLHHRSETKCHFLAPQASSSLSQALSQNSEQQILGQNTGNMKKGRTEELDERLEQIKNEICCHVDHIIVYIIIIWL